jgi:C4-dicarboxylate-binding protein DctP
MKKFTCLLLLIPLALALAASAAVAEKPIEFSLSVDTVMDHPRNQGIVVFIKNLEKESNGRLKVKFYHSAQLYKDKDLFKALSLGTVDMGIPGIWFMDKIDPNAALTALPMFYAQPPQVTRKLVDGDFGRGVSDSLEKKLNVVVPGHWYELGYVALHTTEKQIKKLEDLKGLKIRYFGSPANAARVRALGANPVPVPWPDMSMALMRNTVDGLITSFKPLHSAKLVDAGIKYSVKDREYLMHYVPMCSKKFWKRLPDDLRKLFVKVWNEHVPGQRENARKMQLEGELAVEKLEKAKGGGIFRPSDEVLAKWRAHIMPAQPPLVKQMKMDQKLVDKAMQMLGMK